jgi:GT2 family glycosyltransferase
MQQGLDMNNYEISFVAIEFHSLGEIRELVSNISNRCEGIKFEIVVSSNSKYSVAKQKSIRDEFPELTWVFNPSNDGFASGMNAGIRVSSGTIVAIMNPDARILNDGIRKVIRYLTENTDVGLIGPKTICIKGHIQDTCRKFMVPTELIKRQFFRFIKEQKALPDKGFDYDLVQDVDWVIGAFMAFRKEAALRVGVLDDSYFMYVEDMDWCKRFWDNNLRVVFYPELLIEYEATRSSVVFLAKRKAVSPHFFQHLKSYLRFLRKFGLFPAR